MTLSAEHIQADLDRLFADWGVEVTHQLVTAAFDAATLSLVEDVDEAELMALISGNQREIAAGTGGQFGEAQIAFTFLTGDLPAISAGQIRRIEFLGQTYDVIGVDVIAAGQVTTLRCRKRGAS